MDRIQECVVCVAVTPHEALTLDSERSAGSNKEVLKDVLTLRLQRKKMEICLSAKP